MSTSTSTSTMRADARVVQAMESIAPLALADKSFDNVGLLLEAPEPRPGQKVLLGIDLTPAVAAEILADTPVSVAVIYHPVIFKPLKALSFSPSAPGSQAPNPALVKSVLQLASAGVSIYCPHTALDAARGGMNDWLLAAAVGDAPTEAVRAILPSPPPPAGAEAQQAGEAPAGFGRVAQLPSGRSVAQIVQSLKSATGLAHVQVALAHPQDTHTPLHSVAVCCGAGSGILSSATADVYVTGEMSHHEVLATVASGTSVVLLNHSNSERGYLASVLRGRLASRLGPEWHVAVSAADRDPLHVY